MTDTIELRTLDRLDRHEGSEAHLVFGVGGLARASAALQRLRRKGLVACAQFPDGAWCWWLTDEGEQLWQERNPEPQPDR